MMRKAIGWCGLAVVLALGCGGGGGGGGGAAATRFKDELGNDSFIPALGETAALATFDFPGTPEALETLVYSASDPDLFLAMAEAIYVGRISTKKIERYCGAAKPATYATEHEPLSAYFTLQGEQLVFFAPSISTSLGMPRFVCTHDAVVSQDPVAGSPSVTQGYARATVPAADGFWGLVPAFGTPTQIVHVKYDGTIETMAAPPSTEHATEPVGRAFYFHQDATVTKFDTATQMTSVVATGVSGALAFINDRGLAMTGPPAQIVVFAKGTTPVTTAGGLAGVPGGTVSVVDFLEPGGAGAIFGATRFDLTTGALTQLTYTTPPAIPFAPVFTTTGFAYALQGNLHQIDIWVKPTTAAVTIDPAHPDFSLTPYPVEVSSSANNLSFYAYPDGSCLFGSGSGQGGTPQGGTSIGPVARGSNRTLSAGRCGATSAKTILVGFASYDRDSAFMDLLRRPFFTALHARERELTCSGVCGSFWEMPEFENFESAWTLDASGNPLPLYQLVTGAWPRPRTLQNFIVRREGKLLLLAGAP